MKSEGQRGASSDFYDFFRERQLNLLVMVDVVVVAVVIVRVGADDLDERDLSEYQIFVSVGPQN